MNRRRFLGLGVAGVAAAIVPHGSGATVSKPAKQIAPMSVPFPYAMPTARELADRLRRMIPSHLRR